MTTWLFCDPKAAERFAGPNPEAFTVRFPSEVIEAPGTFSVKRKASPFWSCCAAFGLALIRVNSAFEFTPV
jgi:hypothetical protein